MGGGGHYHPMKTDPAIERWQQMHATMHTRFRVTRSNIGSILGFGVVFPAVVYAIATYTDGTIDMRASLRGEPAMKPLGSRPTVYERAEMERKPQPL